MRKRSTSKGKKPHVLVALPESLKRAINETFASLTRPIPPGEGAEAAEAYRTALLRDRDRLQSVVLWRWRQLVAEASPAYQESQSDFWRLIREGYDQCNAELADAGFTPPDDDISKWTRLAKIIEANPEFSNLAELTDAALTWAEREAVRERIRQRVRQIVLDNEKPGKWSEPMDKSDIAKGIKRSLKTLGRWVDDGKIELKPCGGKWRYRLPEK